MNQLRNDQIRNALSSYLTKGEALETIGIFKKVPTVRWMIFTRGFAWIMAQEFHVGVTDQRLIILPISDRCRNHKAYETPLFADFSEVILHRGPFNSTMLDTQVEYRGKLLNLRFKDRSVPGADMYDFITVLKQNSAL